MAREIGFLCHELTVDANGREHFATATPADIHPAAETFALYRLTSLAVIRQTDAAARRMFLSDLRDIGRRSFAETQLIAQLLSHFSPQLAEQRTISKDPMFEEVVLPERLRAYTADLSSLGALLKPNQPMANYVSRELARGEMQNPSYAPYIAPICRNPPGPFRLPNTQLL